MLVVYHFLMAKKQGRNPRPLDKSANPWFPGGSYLSSHPPENPMSEQLLILANEVGAFIARQYPFHSAPEAAMAYLDFRPRKYPSAYANIRLSFMETFERAFICSELERIGTPSAKALIPEIRNTSLAVFQGFLQTEELILSASDRQLLTRIIRNAGKDFTTALTLANLDKLQ